MRQIAIEILPAISSFFTLSVCSTEKIVCDMNRRRLIILAIVTKVVAANYPSSRYAKGILGRCRSPSGASSISLLRVSVTNKEPLCRLSILWLLTNICVHLKPYFRIIAIILPRNGRKWWNGAVRVIDSKGITSLIPICFIRWNTHSQAFLFSRKNKIGNILLKSFDLLSTLLASDVDPEVLY